MLDDYDIRSGPVDYGDEEPESPEEIKEENEFIKGILCFIFFLWITEP